MSDANPEMHLVFDSTYEVIEPGKIYSPQATALNALGCFLLASYIEDQDMEEPIPGIPEEDITDQDYIEFTVSRYVTSNYSVSRTRSVVFDQLLVQEDDDGNYHTNPEKGYISMQILENNSPKVQYIFSLKGLDDGDASDCLVYCGWKISEETLLTSPAHLQKLNKFLDKLRKVIIRDEVQEVIDLPDIVIEDASTEDEDSDRD